MHFPIAQGMVQYDQTNRVQRVPPPHTHAHTHTRRQLWPAPHQVVQELYLAEKADERAARAAALTDKVFGDAVNVLTEVFSQPPKHRQTGETLELVSWLASWLAGWGTRLGDPCGGQRAGGWQG
jgi:hypothetical protein